MSKQEVIPEKGGDEGAGEGVALPMNLIKSLRRKNTSNSSSEGGSSNGEGNGNNSDNSALVSLGNTSFGFNFDSEEGNSPPDSERNGESDSDGGGNGNTTRKHNKAPATTGNSDHHHHQQQQQQHRPKVAIVSSDTGTGNESSISGSSSSNSNMRQTSTVPQHPQVSDSERKSISPLTSAFPSTSSSMGGGGGSGSGSGGAAATSSRASDTLSSHNMAADAAVANLHSIATAYMSKNQKEEDDDKKTSHNIRGKMDNDSNGGYNSDDEGAARRGDHKIAHHPDKATSSAGVHERNKGTSTKNKKGSNQNNNSSNSSCTDNDDERPKKKKKLNDKKREERNAREKERSFRISKQINELRNLLSNGGVIVPKGTKSSVLTEAANYIRMLQQHQYRSEIDRNQLVQQIQMIGGGAHGQQAAQAIRHVAAKNGVWSLGNFGGVPPKSAMAPYDSTNDTSAKAAPVDPLQQTTVEEHEYRSVFNNCAVGMAIASMGGAFIDCNHLFCQLSNYTKQEVCSLTIFNMTARQDLQHAFDLISQLISPPMEAPNNVQQPIVLRGALNNRSDLGLGIALVKGDDGIAKFFCVTLIMNPSSPFDDSKPIPATIELIQGTPSLTDQVQKDGAGMDSAPAFTSG